MLQNSTRWLISSFQSPFHPNAAVDTVHTHGFYGIRVTGSAFFLYVPRPPRCARQPGLGSIGLRPPTGTLEFEIVHLICFRKIPGGVMYSDACPEKFPILENRTTGKQNSPTGLHGISPRLVPVACGGNLPGVCVKEHPYPERVTYPIRHIPIP